MVALAVPFKSLAGIQGHLQGQGEAGGDLGIWFPLLCALQNTMKIDGSLYPHLPTLPSCAELPSVNNKAKEQKKRVPAPQGLGP